jgi:DNA segregation ATPase FtsK/SpoIIIE-like protein
MLIGRSYIGEPRNEYVSFDDVPHTLICGITGAGKSVLLQTMLLSLCAGTSPDELKLVLVDLKNEDLVPFERLPHVLAFAGTKPAALQAIRAVVAEKDRRVENRGHKPYRLVLVIDEMAQLASDNEIREMLGDLASIGRSKAINLIGATQHPTEKGGLGSLLKANFSLRLAGMVAPGQSYIATGRPQTHADLLPGKGAFLRCEGPNLYRFQSFYIEPGEVVGMAKFVGQQWGQPPVITGYGNRSQPVITGGGDRLHTSTPPVEAITGYDNQFPISSGRPLTDEEAGAVRAMAASGEYDWRGVLSLTRLCMAVYGSKDDKRLASIRAALHSDAKIIKLRRSA